MNLYDIFRSACSLDKKKGIKQITNTYRKQNDNITKNPG